MVDGISNDCALGSESACQYPIRWCSIRDGDRRVGCDWDCRIAFSNEVLSRPTHSGTLDGSSRWVGLLGDFLDIDVGGHQKKSQLPGPVEANIGWPKCSVE